MAISATYYKDTGIIVYPTSNSRDEGKINLEKNMAAFVTRITNRNYALTRGSFNLVIDPDTEYGQVISVGTGEANIQGYHVITSEVLRVPPPIGMEAGNHIVLGAKLSREIVDNNLLGDVTYAGVTHYEGIWVGYFKLADILDDKDIFILGYLDWNGSAMSNLVENPEKYGRLDAKDIICYLSDPKHPEYEFLTLQELTDNLKDWYVSKIGDDEYGEILWRTMDKPTDPDNWGISAVANSSSKSTITLKPSLVTDVAHRIVITSDFVKPSISIADTEMSTMNSDFTVNSVRDIILNSGRDIRNIADNSIISKTDTTNSLTTTLTSTNYKLSNALNAKDIDFNITSSDLNFKIGDSLFDYNNASRYLTLSGNQRIVVTNPIEFQDISREITKLYFGPNSHTESWINKDDLKLTTTKNYTINLGDNNNGLRIKSSTSGQEPAVRVEDQEGAYSELKTNKNNTSVILNSVSTGTDYLYFNNSSNSNNNNYLYKLSTSTAIRVQKDFIADGDISANKVWRAVYN